MPTLVVRSMPTLRRDDPYLQRVRPTPRAERLALGRVRRRGGRASRGQRAARRARSPASLAGRGRTRASSGPTRARVPDRGRASASCRGESAGGRGSPSSTCSQACTLRSGSATSRAPLEFGTRERPLAMRADRVAVMGPIRTERPLQRRTPWNRRSRRVGLSRRYGTSRPWDGAPSPWF